MTSVTLNLPATVFSALRKTPDEFAQEMRVAAAVKWYELEQVSQGKAAESEHVNAPLLTLACIIHEVTELFVIPA